MTKTVVNVLNSDDSVDEDGVIDVAGDKVVYQITLANTGNTDIASPVVSDPLVGGNLPNSGGSLGSTVVTVSGDAGTIGTLEIGETWTYNVTYTTTSGDLTNPAYDTPTADALLTLPDTVELRTMLPGTTYSLMGTTRDSYADAFVYDGFGGANPDFLNGWSNIYCVDVDNNLSRVFYTAKVFSSYDANILDGSLNSTDPTLNYGVDRPENFDLVNWILNQNFIDTDAGGGLGNYTAGDVQSAIWQLIDDNGSTADLAPYDPARAAQIYNLAAAVGSGVDSGTIDFTPTFGDKVAILLTPINDQGLVISSQKTIIEYTLAEGGLRNTATATASGVTDSTDFVDVGVHLNPTIQPITYTISSSISGLT